VLAGFATLEEVKTRWTLDDVMDAGEILDAREAQEARMAKGKGR
jgi:hypothetical protein